MKKKELNLALYKTIYLIRKSESLIIQKYPEDDMKTPMHMSMGEEAITAGVCQALRKEDQVFGTYRSHALYLSKTQETDKFFAEMLGKVNGVVRGKGGSMHLSAPESGFMGTSAVVASNIPVAVGAAFANKYKNNKKIVAVFFGDGAVEEGVFWESVNMACLMKLPIIFVCEDNGLSVHTNKKARQGFRSISKVIEKFDCKVFETATTDPEEIYNLTLKAKKIIKSINIPVFFQFHYYRYLEHVGVNKDFDSGYRGESEFKKWLNRDPLELQKEKLLKFRFKKGFLEATEKKIDSQIKKSFEKAKTDRFPQKKELFTDVYYG